MGSRPAKRATRGRLAQLVRAPVLHAGGQRFKSSTAHHFLNLKSPYAVISIRALLLNGTNLALIDFNLR